MRNSVSIICILMNIALSGYAQKVGINTLSPVKLFSVNGSILLDQDNKNTGLLDSAGLRLGTASLVGISSNRYPPGINPNGLDLWTSGIKRLSITSAGYVGINTAEPTYPLHVFGNAKVEQLIALRVSTTSSMIVGTDLNVYDDISVQDDAFIFGNMGVGGSMDPGYKLKVTGNGLFTTNVGIDGTLRVDGKITNGGKGIVKSNTGTTLRAGFSSGVVNGTIVAGSYGEASFNIPTFSGDNDNARVSICQFTPGTGASNTWHHLNIVVRTVIANDPSCNCSRAMIRFTNPTGSNINMGTGAVLYLLTVVTD
ncbi:MAG TPA: hypothetical protein VGK46_09305 [Saprospiraceae bacterium]